MTEPLFRLEKSGGRVVIVRYAEYEGTQYLDLRQWVTKAGELHPTGKGVTVPLEAVRTLGEVLVGATPPPALSGPERAS